MFPGATAVKLLVMISGWICGERESECKFYLYNEGSCQENNLLLNVSKTKEPIVDFTTKQELQAPHH